MKRDDCLSVCSDPRWHHGNVLRNSFRVACYQDWRPFRSVGHCRRHIDVFWRFSSGFVVGVCAPIGPRRIWVGSGMSAVEWHSVESCLLDPKESPTVRPPFVCLGESIEAFLP